MKSIKGVVPDLENDDRSIGNQDCIFISYGREFLAIVDEYVHAVRVRDNVGQNSIRANTMYLYPTGEWNPNVIREVIATFDIIAPESYSELVEHFSIQDDINMFGDTTRITRNTELAKTNVIRLKVNDCECGFYIPSINSWIIGDWTWHIDYVNIVTRYVFPQFVNEIPLEHCSQSIASERRNNSTTKRISVTVGADPELEVTRNGEVVRADTNLTIKDPMRSEIGQDGSSAQLEFRPKPGKPSQVIKNIRQLVKQFSASFPEYDITDTGDKYPLGGHIHIGVGRISRVPRDLVTLLDDFVGKPTLELSGKARNSYKSLSAVRCQPHGFEYRSTPSAVFQNPRICFTTLKLVENICNKFFNCETMVYHDEPTLEDYINIGGLSKAQAKYFIDFCKSYQPTKSIRASWKVDPAPINKEVATIFNNIVINFRDDWNPSVRVSVTADLENSVNPFQDRPYTITLYGLNSKRGSCLCTLPVTGLNICPPIRDTWSDDRRLAIGFSYDLRTYGLPRSVMSELALIIRRMIIEREALL